MRNAPSKPRHLAGRDGKYKAVYENRDVGLSLALCFIAGRFHLTFTSGKHLFMLERASATTAPAHTCIAPLGRRILLEIWNGACGWWLQQHGGQQQYGQLFGVCFVWSV